MAGAIVRAGGGGLTKGGVRMGDIVFTCDRPTGLSTVMGPEAAFCINAAAGGLLTIGICILNPVLGLIVLGAAGAYTLFELKGERNMVEAEIKSAAVKEQEDERVQEQDREPLHEVLARLRSGDAGVSNPLPPTVIKPVDPRAEGLRLLVAEVASSVIHGAQAGAFTKQYAEVLRKVGFKVFVVSFSAHKYQADKVFSCTDINDQTGRRNALGDAMKELEKSSKAVLIFEDIDLIAGLTKKDAVSKGFIQKAIDGAPLLAKSGKIVFLVGKSKVKASGMRDVAVNDGLVSIDGGQGFGVK